MHGNFLHWMRQLFPATTTTKQKRKVASYTSSTQSHTPLPAWTACFPPDGASALPLVDDTWWRVPPQCAAGAHLQCACVPAIAAAAVHTPADVPGYFPHADVALKK